MQKLNISKLAHALSNKERVGLYIANSHNAAVGKAVLSDAEVRALFSDLSNKARRECLYFIRLHTLANFFLRQEIEKLWLKIAILFSLTERFHVSFLLDEVLKATREGLESVPKFLSESEFKEKRKEEMDSRAEPVACLATYETNALLREKGFFEGKEDDAFYLDEWEPQSTWDEIENEYGAKWVKTYREQVERIRSLIQAGALVSVPLPESDKDHAAVKISGVQEAVTVESWFYYEGKHDKDYKLPIELNETHAISYDWAESYKRERRDEALELLKRYEVTEKGYDAENDCRVITIKEDSFLLYDYKQVIESLQSKIQFLFEFKAAVDEIEKELNGAPLFDEKTYAKVKGCWEDCLTLVSSYNKSLEAIEKWNGGDDVKCVLKDKELYLVKLLPPQKDVVREIVDSFASMAKKEMGIY